MSTSSLAVVILILATCVAKPTSANTQEMLRMKMLSSDFCDEIYYRSYEMAQHYQWARLKEPSYYFQYGDTDRMQKFTIAIHEQVGFQNLYSVEEEKTVAADGFATGMQYACVAMETK